MAFDSVRMEFGGDDGREVGDAPLTPLYLRGGDRRRNDSKEERVEGFAGLSNSVALGAKVKAVFAGKHLCR